MTLYLRKKFSKLNEANPIFGVRNEGPYYIRNESQKNIPDDIPSSISSKVCGVASCNTMTHETTTPQKAQNKQAVHSRQSSSRSPSSRSRNFSTQGRKLSLSSFSL